MSQLNCYKTQKDTIQSKLTIGLLQVKNGADETAISVASPPSTAKLDTNIISCVQLMLSQSNKCHIEVRQSFSQEANFNELVAILIEVDTNLAIEVLTTQKVETQFDWLKQVKIEPKTHDTHQANSNRCVIALISVNNPKLKILQVLLCRTKDEDLVLQKLINLDANLMSNALEAQDEVTQIRWLTGLLKSNPTSRDNQTTCIKFLLSAQHPNSKNESLRNCICSTKVSEGLVIKLLKADPS